MREAFAKCLVLMITRRRPAFSFHPPDSVKEVLRPNENHAVGYGRCGHGRLSHAVDGEQLELRPRPYNAHVPFFVCEVELAVGRDRRSAVPRAAADPFL